MENSTILIVGLEFSFSQEVQSILEDEGYDIKFISILTRNIINQLVTIKPQLVMIDIEKEESAKCLQLGQYLLNEDLIPFLYMSSNAEHYYRIY